MAVSLFKFIVCRSSGSKSISEWRKITLLLIHLIPTEAVFPLKVYNSFVLRYKISDNCRGGKIFTKLFAKYFEGKQKESIFASLFQKSPRKRPGTQKKIVKHTLRYVQKSLLTNSFYKYSGV